MHITNINKTYIKDNNLTFSCQYHVVFCPKYKRNVLIDDIEVRLKELFLSISQEFNFYILEMNIRPNYVHLIISCNPGFGIMECINKLKNITSKKLRDEFPGLKSKIPSLWTRKVFISTAGDVSMNSINEYLDNQKNV